MMSHSPGRGGQDLYRTEAVGAGTRYIYSVVMPPEADLAACGW